MRTSIIAALAVIGLLSVVGAPLHAQDATLTGAAAYGDFTKDAPGVWRKITVADLPNPGASPGAAFSKIVERPSDSAPHVLPGFTITAMATGLMRPRIMRFASNGDMFVGEVGLPKPAGSGPGMLPNTGRISVIRPGAKPSVFIEGLDRPFGIAFYPPGPNPQYIYVGLTTRIVRIPYHVGDLKASGPPETVVDGILDGLHFTRDVLFSRDGKTMFVSIGSSTNVQNNGPEPEAGKANILAFNPDGSGRRVYAAGLRNPVNMALDPRTNDVWTSVNERDLLGDNLPPDYVTKVHQGAFYGWPYYYIGNHPDGRAKGGAAPVPGDQVTVPDVLIQPHSAPLGITFYTGKQFPADYQGDLFVALHGSWNRAVRTGYKIVRVKLRNGQATGEYEDFVTGFVAPDGDVWGRPVGLSVAPDGALLMSDDGTGTIWRIAYAKSS
jgi:glucose/arabinose dehydrogenase